MVFCFVNTIDHLARLENHVVQNVLRFLEPVLILMVMCQLATVLPDLFPCTPFECTAQDVNATNEAQARI